MPLATVTDLRAARRVLLHGVTGSGKTTAARQLGAALDLPVHTVDDEIGWLPGWVHRSDAEQREIAAALAAGEAWVFDSSYGKWRDLVMPRVEVIVVLDYPRWVSLGRLIRRTLMRALNRRVVCNGNVERWSSVFSRDSIIAWHFRSFDRKRRTAHSLMSASSGPGVLVLRHPRELKRVLAAL